MLNPFATDAFSIQALVAAINILPNNYGKCQQMNIFPEVGVRAPSILIEEKNGVLNLLKTFPRGADGQKISGGTRKVRSLTIPHIPVDDVILPQDYDGIRAFGQENQTETLAGIMNEHLQNIKNKFAITLEYQRMGALKGILYDSDGSTLFNFYNEFLIKPKTVDFVFGTATTDMKKKCLQVRRHIELNLKGEIMSGDPHVFVDKDFFDGFTGHAIVQDAYARWQNGEALRTDQRSGFRFGGLVFEEYEGTATDIGGTERKFLASKYGIAFPVGTMDTFRTFFAPADFLETVNTLGQSYYAKQEPRKFNRGIDIHAQMNPLPICMRPGVLVTVMSST